MTPFKLRSLESAPAEAKPLLQRKLHRHGFVPHLAAQLAASPEALKAYSSLSHQFQSTSLSPGEQLVVLLAASVELRDALGVATWTHLARKTLYLLPPHIEALRFGDVLGNPRLDALANLARQIARRDGRGNGVAMAAFVAAGYEQAQALDVLVGVSQAIVGAHAACLLQTPLNGELQPDWWMAPLREPVKDTRAAGTSEAPAQNRAA